MTKRSTVTAIISAYFASEYLHGRLENLLLQTQVPDEIVVVCQKLSPEHAIANTFEKHVKLVLTPDVPTIYSAWNMAIAASTGEFITNANCDDRLRTAAIEEMARMLKQHPKYAVVYGNQEIVKTIDGPVVGTFDWAEGGLPELLHACFIGPMPMWRRELHAKYGLFDESLRVVGDYEFWLRIASAGERFLHLRAVVGRYLDRQESAEHRAPIRTTWETARVRALYRSKELA